MTLFFARTWRMSLVIALVLATCPTGILTAENVGVTGDLVHELQGDASWYGGKFQGRLTASGEVFDTALLTAAHKTLAFGTIVEVTHLGNDRTVEVRINDRGPFVEGRVIDLSRAAADALDMAGEGVAAVRLRILSAPGEPVRSIQVGAFGMRANAEAVARRVASGGIEAVIEVSEAVYRVIVPNVPESALAVTLERLAEIGFDSVLVRSQ